MTTSTATRPQELDIAATRKRLAQLEEEAARLRQQQAQYRRRLASGITDDELEDLARRLIAGDGESAFDKEAETQLRVVEGQLSVNTRAVAILKDAIELVELRDGYAAAKPLFDKAVAHFPRVCRALQALREELAAAREDLDEFDAAHDPLESLARNHREEKPPYVPLRQRPLRWWMEDFLGDGFNISRLERWREEVADISAADVALIAPHTDRNRRWTP